MVNSLFILRALYCYTGARDIAIKRLILLYYFNFAAKANALKAKKIDFRH
jgi:hypothetical protein